MQLLYNSDSFAVVQFDVPGADVPGPVTGPALGSAPGATLDPTGRGKDRAEERANEGAKDAASPSAAALTASGIEIVDKLARREVFIQGALAERFIEGVKSLAATQPTEDQFDDYIAGFTSAAQQPVVLH